MTGLGCRKEPVRVRLEESDGVIPRGSRRVGACGQERLQRCRLVLLEASEILVLLEETTNATAGARSILLRTPLDLDRAPGAISLFVVVRLGQALS